MSLKGSENVVLTGFMGTGKSSVGRILARRLGLEFIDTDELIEKKAGISIKEIFETKGEPAFRRLEKDVIKEITSTRKGVVLATGGGAVVDEENRERLKSWGTLVCLVATVDAIVERTGSGDERPLLNEKDRRSAIEELLKKRESAYRDSHLMVDTTGRTKEEVADIVMEFLEKKTDTLWVRLEKRVDESYPIYIKRGILDEAGRILKGVAPSERCAVVTNPTVGSLYCERFVKALEKEGFTVLVVEVPDGEEYKNLDTVATIYDRLLSERLERDSLIVALGGGVVGDIAGFVAATFLRGVAYVQVPTTLLAQVDSSVGGKTGVNHPKGKNLIGAFYQPRAVLIDPDVLKTLDERELRAGLAEVVKYGVIWDEAFFGFLEENREGLLALDEPIIEAIKRSCAIKAEVVSRDEKEAGLRSILNFGHTFGHAIEALTGYSRYRHGEAVSIGMVMAAGLSCYMGLTDATTQKRIEALLSSLGLPVTMPEGLNVESIIDTIRLDKKVKRGKIRFVLTERIGRVVLREVEPETLRGYLSATKV